MSQRYWHKLLSFGIGMVLIGLLISCDSQHIRRILSNRGLVSELKQLNSCRGCSPQSDTGEIHIVNDLPLSLAGVYIVKNDASEWGSNLLSEEVAPGNSFIMQVVPGLWNTAVVDSMLIIRTQLGIRVEADAIVEISASSMNAQALEPGEGEHEVEGEGESEEEGEGEGEDEEEGEDETEETIEDWRQYPDLGSEQEAIQQTRQSFQKAMRAGDIESAVQWIHEDMQGVYRALFEQRPEAAASFADLLDASQMQFLSPAVISEDPANEIVIRTAEYVVSLEGFDFYIRWIKEGGTWRLLDL